MANYLKTQIWRKSYLIEFMQTDGKVVEESFTFSVPPENEELTYGQRKSETKTFGGLHVDDYGIDAVKISLSGSTINQDLKKIFRPGSSEKWLTGEEEIYYFRDLLNKYKTGKDNIHKAIMLYDLSKTFQTDFLDDSSSTTIKNYWRVFPGDFKISRSKDKPFTYKYTLEVTGVSLENAQNIDVANHGPPPPELTPKKLDLLKRMMNGLLAALDFIDNINGKINDVLAKIDEVSNLLNTLGNVMKYATSTIGGVMDSIGDTAAGFMDSVTNVVEGVHTVVALPRTIQMKAVNIGLEVYNATAGLVKETASLVKECRDMFDPDSGYWDIPKEVLDQFNMTSAEFKDSVAVMCDDAENIANELATAAKSEAIPEVTIGDPDPDTGAQRLVLAYGHSTVTLKSTDSLESLAAQYYGSPDNAMDVATYNGVASIDELSPGEKIKIPILNKTQRNRNNRIYARRETRDNYGRDIALTDDGYLLASPNGDYKLTSGASNLSQAVLLRLRESVDKRVRKNAYGIRTNISDPTAGTAYVLSSIDMTVRSEPRVKSIENIRFTGRGDSLIVTVDYTDINRAGGTAAGRA